MKKVLSILLIAFILCLTSCAGNNSLSEGMTNKSNTMTYAVTEQTIENITYRVLYPVDKWADSSSDAFCIKFERNGKYQIIWMSFNTAKLYHSIPEAWEYDVTYEDLCKQYSK